MKHEKKFSKNHWINWHYRHRLIYYEYRLLPVTLSGMAPSRAMLALHDLSLISAAALSALAFTG
jgi:hypothetical protein